MALHDIPNERLYKDFLSTLSESIMLWYQKLRNRSIESFNQLSKVFLGHFSIRRTWRNILTNKQREWETLREYSTRFIIEDLTIQNLDDMVAATMFVDDVTTKCKVYFIKTHSVGLIMMPGALFSLYVVWVSIGIMRCNIKRSKLPKSGCQLPLIF